ncbi:MAG: response regulator [Vicinamibacterales bacterium]
MVIPVPVAFYTSVLRPAVPNRVLVVDDEPLIRWSVCTALEAAGFDAVAAATGSEARQLAIEWPPPRVAVIDLLGDEDTGELLEHVRGIYPECKFILMTTAHHPAQRHRGRSVEVVEKPFDLDSLVLLVKRLIDDAPGAPLQKA